MEQYQIPDQVSRPMLRIFCRVRTVEQSLNTQCSTCGRAAICDLQVFVGGDRHACLLRSYCSDHCKDGQELVLQNAGDFFVVLDGNDKHEFGLEVPQNQNRYDTSLWARLQAAEETRVRDEAFRTREIVDELVKYQMKYNSHMFRGKDNEYPMLAGRIKELEAGGG